MRAMSFAGETSDWRETTLWKQLKGREGSTPAAQSAVHSLETCMPKIQKVLAQGGTSPAEFTLHDSGHAFRVAQKMVEIIPEEALSGISPFENALLLLSAYLHDIGMTPERHKVQLHRTYLLSGEVQDLGPDKVEEFQRWLDDESHAVTPPICKGTPSPQELRLAEELVSYYCRYRHADWSEEWIRTNISEIRMGTYKCWIDDLIALCRSHHQGYLELKSERLQPKPVGSPSEVVNLRYLAAVLRLADVLEFDPERTPEVIFKHRDIAATSVIFWWKDHEISLRKSTDQYTISARPKNALIHKAVDTMADDIDRELNVCWNLNNEIGFGRCPGQSEPLPHSWKLKPSIFRDISPLDDTYEYIDGTFRPDTRKILELLSGVELYGNPLVAVRELLQNSFDAVKEQIAYQRLSRPKPSNRRHELELGKLHNVKLSLDITGGEIHLVCRDDGVGMSKEIIQNHLLVSGSARRHDVLMLERRCRERGFALGRTGEFGIGVLSYFMLADRVTISTRRSQEAEDHEQIGWHFETEGIGSFGELRRDSFGPRGTEIRLRLRKEIVGDDPEQWYSSLKDYVRQILSRIPCHFEMISHSRDVASLRLRPGWVRSDADIKAALVSQLTLERRSEETPFELLPEALRREREEEDRLWADIRRDAKQCLRLKSWEADLPGGLGRARIHLPFFMLPGGASLGFLRINTYGRNAVLERIGHGHAHIPRTVQGESWKGIRIMPRGSHGWTSLIPHNRSSFERRPSQAPVHLEVDWTFSEAGRISVTRDNLLLNREGYGVLHWIYERIREMAKDWLRENKESPYSLLNERIAWCTGQAGKGSKWIFHESHGNEVRAVWKPVRFPNISSLVFAYTPIPPQLKWRGREIEVMRCLGQKGDDDHYDGLAWNPPDLPPSRVVAISIFRLNMAPLWSGWPRIESNTCPAGVTSAFPPAWRGLAGVFFNNYYATHSSNWIWNPRSPVVAALDDEGWRWATKKFEKTLDPLFCRDEVLSRRGCAAAWVIRCLMGKEKDLWDGLRDRDPSFLNDLWRLLFAEIQTPSSTSGPTVLHWHEDVPHARLRVLRPEGWHVLQEREEIEKYLPDPGQEWQLIRELPERIRKRHLEG